MSWTRHYKISARRPATFCDNSPPCVMYAPHACRKKPRRRHHIIARLADRDRIASLSHHHRRRTSRTTTLESHSRPR